MSKLKQPRRSGRQRILRSRSAQENTSEPEPVPASNEHSAPPPVKLIKWLIWLYLFLLIFDGAFRKWFLPGLSNLLLVSRVPVIAMIYLLAIPARSFKINGYIIATAVLTITTIPLALVAHGSVTIAVYGALTNYFGIPLIFIIPRVLDYDDTEQIGRFLLYLVIPMTVLIAMQFYSPQSAWVNRSVGGSEGAGFTGALGRFRPPGTFSFITGVAQFYTLAFAFFLGQFVNKRTLPIWLLYLTGAAFLTAVYGSISRTLALSVLVVYVGCIAGLVINGRKLHNMFKISIAAIVFYLIASQFTYFADGVETFMARWNSALRDETTATDAVVDRTILGMLRPVLNPTFDPVIGMGLGIGTNAGAKLITNKRAFLMGENEWDRIMGELGPIFGYAYIMLRFALGAYVSFAAFRQLFKGNILPWLLLSASLLIIINGQWGQQTTLGFAILSAGLILSACNVRPTVNSKPT